MGSIPIWGSEIFQSKDIARQSFTYTYTYYRLNGLIGFNGRTSIFRKGPCRRWLLSNRIYTCVHIEINLFTSNKQLRSGASRWESYIYIDRFPSERVASKQNADHY